MSRSIPSLPCTVATCDAPLHLVISSDIPLYRENPPWPGAGPEDYTTAGANAQGWEVVCEGGHTVWTHVDQIRADNAAGLTDDDETGDVAPLFRMEPLRKAVGQ